MSKQRSWTTQEEKILKENYRDMTVKELSNKLNRSLDSVNAKAKRLGLKKRNTLYRVIKNEEVIAIGTSDDLAKRLGVKKKTIHEYSTPRHIRRGYSFKVEKAGVLE